MINADLHVHSEFSSDSREPLEQMARFAAEKGLKTVCFTEHMDFDYPTGEFQLDTEAYRRELLRVRAELQGKIEILFGVELGLLDYDPDRLYRFVSDHEFDFVIGSVHTADGMDPYYPDYFERYGGKNGILRFFEKTLACIKVFDGFDVLGHLDYIVRYSPEKKYAPVDFREVIDEILKAVVSKGKGIEINSKGVPTIGYPHPHPFVLSRYKELGGEIVTIGSDAHDSSRIAADFDRAEQALKNADFNRCSVFRRRSLKWINL